MSEKNRFTMPDANENRLMKYVVRIAAAVVILALGIFLYLNTHEKKETDTERGVAKLVEMEAIDVAETEKTIRGMREQNMSDEISSNEDLTSTMKGEYLDASILIVGDSSAQLLLDYDILDDSCVMASIGSGVATGMSLVNTACALAPENIVLNFGLDDMVYFEGDDNEFITDYESMINTIRETLPKTKIYLCEITAVASDALELQPEYAYVDQFNTAIKRLARTANVTCLETNDLVDEYATDGVHPAYSYYVSFAQRVLNQAGGIQTTADTSGEDAAGDENE